MRRTPGPSNYGYEPLKQDENAIEDENQRLEEELKNKIGILKSLTIDIGNEGEISVVILKSNINESFNL